MERILAVAGGYHFVTALSDSRREKIFPKQLPVAGFDDIPLATQMTPNRTTARQPMRDMVREAAETLLPRIANAKGTPRLVSIDGRLVTGDSTDRFSPTE